MNPEKEEKENPKEKAPPKPAGPRLGKEAKIGMAVILTLLAVLVAVVVVRIRGSGSGEKAVAAADRDQSTKKPPGQAKKDKLFDDKLFDSFKTKPAAAGPTVVPAKAAVIRPPRLPDTDPWKFTSDRPAAQRPSGDELPPPSPPLLLPEPSKSLPARRHDERAGEPPSRYGPLHRGDPGGLASAGDGASAKAASPPPGPPAGEKGRHEDPKAARTPTPTPVSEPKAGLGRREPPSPKYGGDPPRRSDAPPSFPDPPPSFRDPPPSYRSDPPPSFRDPPPEPFRDPPVRR